MSSTSRLGIVAIDDGYDFTKVVTRANLKGVRIPTSYSLKPSNTASVMGTGENAETVYDVEGMKVSVGPHVKAEDTRFEGFPFHQANLAVALDAIRRVVEPGAPIQVVAGVPFNRYYLPSGDADRDISARKAKAWSRFVRCARFPALPRIHRVTVIAEAAAAWFDYVINDSFEVLEVADDFTAVVDIGGRTTDIAVFQHQDIKMDLSGTIDSGMLQVQKRVLNVLAKDFRNVPFTRAILDDAVRHGKITLSGKDHDISEEVIAGRQALAAEIEVFIKTKFGDHLPLINKLLFVGGGAQSLHFELKDRFPDAAFAQDPQMANARGMLKYAYYNDFDQELPDAANA